MTTKNTNTRIQKSYSKYNKIRTKLLLFIDNEIRAKMNQKNYKLKYKFDDEKQFKISFEETFIQKENNRYDFPYSNILKTQNNDNLDKSISTVDVSTNTIIGKSQQKNRGNIHSKTLNKGNSKNKLFNNIISINKKFYSIKNLSRQSSTFLILPKQKNSAEYLKNLCNNLKISADDKKLIKHIKTINIDINFFDLSNDKKNPIKSNEIDMQKSKKDQCTYSLFRNSQKGNFVNNSIEKKPVKYIKSISNNKLFDFNYDKNIPKKSYDKKIQKSKKDNVYNFPFFRQSQKGNLVMNSKHRVYGKSTQSILITIK